MGVSRNESRGMRDARLTSVFPSTPDTRHSRRIVRSKQHQIRKRLHERCVQRPARRPPAGDGAGALHVRLEPAGPALRAFPPLRPGARGDRLARRAARARGAGRRGGVHRRGHGEGELQGRAAAREVSGPRRHDAQGAAPRRARERARALRRPGGRARRGADGGSGAGCGGGDRGRVPRPAAGDRRRGGARARARRSCTRTFPAISASTSSTATRRRRTRPSRARRTSRGSRSMRSAWSATRWSRRRASRPTMPPPTRYELYSSSQGMSHIRGGLAGDLRPAGVEVPPALRRTSAADSASAPTPYVEYTAALLRGEGARPAGEMGVVALRDLHERLPRPRRRS